MGWVGCWFSTCSKRFFRVLQFFFLPKNKPFPISNWIRIKDPAKADLPFSSLNIVIYFLLLFTLSLFHLFIDAFTMIRVWRISSNILAKEKKRISRLRLKTSRNKYHILVRFSKLDLYVKQCQWKNFTWEEFLFLHWTSQTRRRLERHVYHLHVSKNRKKVENKCFRLITTLEAYWTWPTT